MIATTDSDGQHLTINGVRLAVRGVPSLRSDDGQVIIGIDLPAMVQVQYRAVAKDFGDGLPDTWPWHPDLAGAQTDLYGLRDCEEPYDLSWIETRWVTGPWKIEERVPSGGGPSPSAPSPGG